MKFREILEAKSERANWTKELLKMDKEQTKKLKYYFKVVWKDTGSVKDMLDNLDNHELMRVWEDFIGKKDLKEYDQYFKDLSMDYLAIAKIHTQGKVITLKFKGEEGARNAWDDIQAENRPGYSGEIKKNMVIITKEG